MKTLIESILDNEDVLVNDDNYVIKQQISKFNDQLQKAPIKKGCDMRGNKLSPGDFVMVYDLYRFRIGYIYNISPKLDKCNIIEDENDKSVAINYTTADIYKYRTHELIKVDPIKAMELLSGK